MFFKGGFSMNTNRLLISSAMLTALCETRESDNLSLLEPFVRTSIARSTELNSKIDKALVISHLQDDFAFSDVPVAVLDKVLLRMEKKNDRTIRRTSTNENEFILLKDLSSERLTFESLQSRAQDELNCVLDALLDWFETGSPKLKATRDKLIVWLGSFFESRGVDILFQFDELKGATTTNTDAINYQIGRFIIDTKEHNSTLFDKIVHIAQGMMLVSAIYIDTKPATKFLTQRAMSDVAVFFDTTLLLYAMGYKTESQENATGALFDLLAKSGAKLYVFPQHLREIKDILYAFKWRDGYDKAPFQTLERLEQNHWTSPEIDSEIQFLETRLQEKLGVSVYNGNHYIDENGHLREGAHAYIDIDGLSEHIKKRIPQYEKSFDMLKNDVDAIGSIIALRNGMVYETVETCPAIFVSTNYSLIRESNYFLKYLAYKQRIAPSMSDTDLTTILWLKYGFSDQSVPRLLLVQHASAAIAPTDAVLNKFFQVTKNLEERGSLSPDEAAFIRYDIYARAEIASLCGGETSAIDDTSVLAIRDRIKERYEKETADHIATLKNEVKIEHAKSLEAQKQINSGKIAVKAALQERNRAREATISAKAELLDNINETAKLKATRVTSAIIFLMRAILVAVAIFCGCVSFYYGLKTTAGILTLVLALISALSSLTLFIPALNALEKIKGRINRALFDRFYSKEYAKLKKQIDILDKAQK